MADAKGGGLMTADLTPEELAGLRERAELADSRGNSYIPIDPETVVRLVAMAERTEAVMADPEVATQQAFREQERAARYREWITEFICPMHLGTSEPCAVEDCEDARAALAEPEEAQHGGD